MIICFNGNITVFGAGASDVTAVARNIKQAISKRCAPLTDCITKIDNRQADNAKIFML